MAQGETKEEVIVLPDIPCSSSHMSVCVVTMPTPPVTNVSVPLFCIICIDPDLVSDSVEPEDSGMNSHISPVVGDDPDDVESSPLSVVPPHISSPVCNGSVTSGSGSKFIGKEIHVREWGVAISGRLVPVCSLSGVDSQIRSSASGSRRRAESVVKAELCWSKARGKEIVVVSVHNES